MSAPLLSVRDLGVRFPTTAGDAVAVDGVSFDVRAGETVALVGESGCGKSATALALLGLVPPPGRVQGSVWFEQRDLLALAPDALRRVRGRGIAMVFQEPLTALNPVLRAGEQVAEAIRLHHGASRAEAHARTLAALEEVGLPEPEATAQAYPHELSGGMRQRVLIALAIACEPRLLVADEPTTALDATVQMQVLMLLRALQRRHGMGLLLITHDLGVVAEAAERVVVLYGGRVAEEASVGQLFDDPRHPYTQALLRSRPERARPGEPLEPIAGAVPAANAWPEGCRFHPRCPLADARCRDEDPEPEALGRARRVACHHADAALAHDGEREGGAS